MVGHWIINENLRPFLEVLSGLVGYRFDDSDWLAVETQLEYRGEPESSATYSLGEQINLKLQLEHGGSATSFEASASPEIEAKIMGAAAVLDTWTVA